ncbi:MAG TPA: TonB-dependent receptor plug domain-containing protein, partial [Gemmatimonadaceae bacterium]|nr:TonB-dependent receptor plug domain-containing protein [Gemmatimonadaceae bacterium]
MAVTAVAVPLAAHAQGTITGRVTAVGTGEPLADARVMVVNSSLATQTGSDGRYTLRGVPTGNLDVRVLRVGYTEQKKPVQVTAGVAATLDFSMAQAIVQLQEIVTTATGDQRKVELGNSLSTINAAQQVETKPINGLADLLTAKAPGVIVQPPNMTGAAPVVRIRGANSLSLNNDPIYIVDGIRINSSTIGANLGGTNWSFLNTLSPEEIEDIEIVKGPSAATLYGTDATNGVIVVTTKKGRVGNARWTWFGEGGTIQDKAHYPDTWAIWGHRPNATATVRCLTRELPSGGCIKDSVTELNIINRSDLTPVHTGNRNQYGGQISGGSETIRYFVSGDLQNETGPIQMPNIEFPRFDSLKTPMRDEWKYPEFLQGQSARANINVSPSSKFDISVNTGFTKLNQRFAETDNNFNSVFYQAMMSPGFVGAGLGNTGKDSRGQNLYGNNSFTYGDVFQRLAREDVQRLVGTTQASWRPFAWLQNDGTVGLDLASRYSYGLCRFGECPDFSSWRLGQVADRH